MPTPSSAAALTETLRTEYQSTSETLRASFWELRDGADLVKWRSVMVDHLIERLWLEHIASDEYEPPGLALTAIGGYGRQQLFPYSDIDLLFICVETSLENRYKAAIRRLCQGLWDIGVRVSA